jgi:peroxiredoxin
MAIFIFSLFLSLLDPGVQSISEVQDFTLTNASDGKQFSFISLKDEQAVVVIFTSNDCPYDKLYSKRVEMLLDKYRKQDVAFVLINSNDPARSPEDAPGMMTQKIKELKWNVPYLIDHSQDVAELFGAQKTPETYLLQYRQGSFQILYSGSIDDNPQVASDVTHHYLEQAIEATLQGEPILVDQTYPAGCMIK